jgi:PAS domain S-box-containing protein
MGMAIENMSLYHHSEQKKREAAFLVRSIAKFNEKLDLEDTLRSVAERSAEFIGLHCRVFLFSETRAPFVEAACELNGTKRSFQSKALKRILPNELQELYTSFSGSGKPLLISRLSRSTKMNKYMKDYFRGIGLHSLMAIPLKLMGKHVGLLVLGSVTGQRAFGRQDLPVAVALGASAVVAIENARAHATSLEMSEFLERKIAEKTTQIRQIEEKQSVRVESRNDIIFRVNRVNRFVFVNKATEIMTGCTREELYRGAIKAEDVVSREDRDRVREVFKSILRGEFPMVKDLEYTHLNLKGDDHVISLTVYAEVDVSGRIVGLEGVGRDITERKRLEAELEKAKNLAMLGEFSAALAHQVRNPLGNILMGTKLLERALGLKDEAAWGSGNGNQMAGLIELDQPALRNIFSDLSQGIYNLNQVVTELLEYTKTFKPSLSSQRVDLIMRESLHRFQDVIEQREVSVLEDFDPHLPPLSVDALLMGQVFQNVIHNAIQAMPSGGSLLLSCGFHPTKPHHVLASISDSGPGLEPSELEKIFRPFYTTKDTGTGLGLSLAHRIVEAHEGQIWACNNPCLHLPRKALGTHHKEISPSKGLTIQILLPIDGNRQWDSVHGSMKNECTGPGSR